jgi:hypothetical protein
MKIKNHKFKFDRHVTVKGYFFMTFKTAEYMNSFRCNKPGHYDFEGHSFNLAMELTNNYWKIHASVIIKILSNKAVAVKDSLNMTTGFPASR